MTVHDFNIYLRTASVKKLLKSAANAESHSTKKEFLKAASEKINGFPKVCVDNSPLNISVSRNQFTVYCTLPGHYVQVHYVHSDIFTQL
jgi:hypothetical protein